MIKPFPNALVFRSEDAPLTKRFGEMLKQTTIFSDSPVYQVTLNINWS